MSISCAAAFAGALMTTFAFIRADHSAEPGEPGPYQSGGCGLCSGRSSIGKPV